MKTGEGEKIPTKNYYTVQEGASRHLIHMEKELMPQGLKKEDPEQDLACQRGFPRRRGPEIAVNRWT